MAVSSAIVCALHLQDVIGAVGGRVLRLGGQVEQARAVAQGDAGDSLDHRDATWAAGEHDEVASAHGGACHLADVVDFEAAWKSRMTSPRSTRPSRPPAPRK